MEILLKKPTKSDTSSIYLKHLVNQFKEATGTRQIHITGEDFEKEIEDWLKERQTIAQNYKMLLDSMDVEYNHPMTAEIGKGIHDTIVYNDETTLITPYTYRLTNDINNKVIKAELEIIDNNNEEITSPLSTVDTIMIENPYSELEIHNWEYLFDNSKYTPIIGIFGKLSDKDREQKIKMLEIFKTKITTGYEEQRYRLRDEYGQVITKKRRIKVK